MTEKEQQGVYSQKYEAQLQQIDSHVGQMEALLERNSAEDLQLTQEEFVLMRRSLETVRQTLTRLLHAGDDDWLQIKAQFESAWSDFQEHSQKITRSASEKPPARA